MRTAPHDRYPQGDVECNKEMMIMSKERSRGLGSSYFYKFNFSCSPVTFQRNSRMHRIEFFTRGKGVAYSDTSANE